MPAVVTVVELSPPASNTVPSSSKVAVWRVRVVDIVPWLAVKVLATGSYSSAVFKPFEPAALLLFPPAISTLPLFSSVAV